MRSWPTLSARRLELIQLFGGVVLLDHPGLLDGLQELLDGHLARRSQVGCDGLQAIA